MGVRKVSAKPLGVYLNRYHGEGQFTRYGEEGEWNAYAVKYLLRARPLNEKDSRKAAFVTSRGIHEALKSAAAEFSANGIDRGELFKAFGDFRVEVREEGEKEKRWVVRIVRGLEYDRKKELLTPNERIGIQLTTVKGIRNALSYAVLTDLNEFLNRQKPGQQVFVREPDAKEGVVERDITEKILTLKRRLNVGGARKGGFEVLPSVMT